MRVMNLKNVEICNTFFHLSASRKNKVLIFCCLSVDYAAQSAELAKRTPHRPKPKK